MAIRLLLALLALTTFASEAAACTCSIGGARAAAGRSTAVYLGRVIGFKASRPGRFGPLGTARLVVTQPVKGARKTDTLVVAFPTNSCSPAFKLGREYLVYTAPDTSVGGESLTDYCAGTKPITCAARDLRELGASVPRRARNCFPVVKERPPRKRPTT